jgi:predicted metalloprotease with PDZ domain
MFRPFRYFAAAALSVTAAQAGARVDYAIDLTAPEHHLAQVDIAFPSASGAYLDVKMPAWRTGRYTILNLANGVRGFHAADARGRPLRWQKIDKSTWRVQSPGQGPIRVGYELYGNELGLRTRHIDDSHAYLDASAVFMYADRFRRDDVAVSLKVPAGWSSFSGMRSAGAQRFVADNWDILVDSPIETGIEKSFQFNEGGRDYQVAIWGEGNYDANRVVSDIRKIVAQAPSIWSGYPFQRYVFMIHATDGVGGATEHRNSTVIQFPRQFFEPRQGYLSFLSTTSHEFIHTWNVKSYRGAGMVPYEYQRENYSDLLWIAEGSTEYFADHLLLRAGLMTPAEYFDGLAAAIDHNRHTPGTKLQSVAEASFDEWISVSGDRARNASVNIYNEGSLVSWMLDIALLEQTGGKVSYRDVHEALYRRFPADRRGFTAADVRAILRQLTGRSWDQWWARYVESPVGTVDFDRLLSPVGLAAVPAGPPIAWAGWSANESDGKVRLTSVERGSPAWNAGFTLDDIIVAIDGKKVAGQPFEGLFSQYRPGATATVSYVRRSQPGEKKIVLGAVPKDGVKVVPLANPSPAQIALFQRWLLIPYPRPS